jgi:hypothetical protein
MTDTALVNTGIKVLIENLGNIDAERFISLINKEEIFDYTEWHQTLYEGMTIEEIAARARMISEKYYDKGRLKAGEPE